MEIFINEIPEEGLHREGELPASIFSLPEGDAIQPAGPVHYAVTMYALDGVVAFTGRLQGPFKLQCGTCLDFFEYEADYPNWSSDLELEDDQRSFDLAEIIREDFIMELPPYPRCDELIEGRVCPKADVIEEMAESVEEVGDNDPDRWKALDDLETEES